jgi:predicted YcjX-like family ATPase
MDLAGALRDLTPDFRGTVRIGVTGLARSGKTAFLTSLAANLLAAGAGYRALPALTLALAGRSLRVSLTPSGAGDVPRFDHASHMAALAADPPHWPHRTDAVSVLGLELEIGRAGLAARLPPRRIRLELVDYPGEWLLDLPLLGQDFSAWSAATLRRLDRQPAARDFLAFARGLPASAPADGALEATGTALYRAALHRLRDDAGLSLLQPGRLLMPAPGPAPPWTNFFPAIGHGGLAHLLGDRFDRYREVVRRDLAGPAFHGIDRLVVLADLLTALHAGPDAYADAAAALEAVAGALRWRGWLPSWLPSWLQPGRIARVAFAASKSDHIGERQRGNLAALMSALTRLPDDATANRASFALAAMRCTEDVVWTLDGRPVSAVRGRMPGDDHPFRSYPGEVPAIPPTGAFWTHPFLALPPFEPLRLPLAGRAGIPHIDFDRVLVFLLEDVL